MEHSELIAEMTYIEKLSTQERLKLARRRRMQQLKKFSQKEKELFSSKKEKTAHNEAQKKKNFSRSVAFASNIILLEAAARNDIDEVKILLDQRINPDSTNEDGLTALHQCCIDDSEEMMRLLVLYGADVNAQDSEKWTPLHAAATCGHLHLAKYLISKGANLLAVNADGNMPYDICEDDATLDYIESEMASRGVTQQLIDDTRMKTEQQMLMDFKKLKEDGKSLMYRDEHGATPLHIAAANGYIHVVEYLLSQNVPTEVQDNDDWSPLHASACWGHPDVLELLAQHGANLQARTKNQETPYDICEDAELRERIVQLINEQETKRLHDQNKRIRRVRSNKRTQSIRRTSVREKTLTPKKDAQDEARMRIQLENRCFPEKALLPDICLGSDMQESAPLVTHFTNGLSQFEYNNKTELNTWNLHRVKEMENEERKKEIENELLVSQSFNENDHDFPDSAPVVSVVEPVKEVEESVVEFPTGAQPICEVVTEPLPPSLKDPGPPIPPPRSSSTALGPPNAVREGGSKIDIHVTVTVNPFSPGTLADLKKQRALSRASQNSYTVSGGSNSIFSLNTSGDMDSSSICTESLPTNPMTAKSFRVPPSPSQSPRRFCGEPSDIIGKNERWLCCSLM